MMSNLLFSGKTLKLYFRKTVLFLYSLNTKQQSLFS